MGLNTIKDAKVTSLPKKIFYPHCPQVKEFSFFYTLEKPGGDSECSSEESLCLLGVFISLFIIYFCAILNSWFTSCIYYNSLLNPEL